MRHDTLMLITSAARCAPLTRLMKVERVIVTPLMPRHYMLHCAAARLFILRCFRRLRHATLMLLAAYAIRS